MILLKIAELTQLNIPWALAIIWTRTFEMIAMSFFPLRYSMLGRLRMEWRTLSRGTSWCHRTVESCPWHQAEVNQRSECDLDVSRHNRNSLRMNGTQVRIFKQANHECFSGLLQCVDSCRLESQITLVITCDLSDYLDFTALIQLLLIKLYFWSATYL